MLVVQYGRISGSLRPQRGDACVMWRRWRLVQDKELYDLSADPAQTRNVIEQHPDIVAKLRAHYEKWWAGVAPLLDAFQPIYIGNHAENPVRLAPGDWQEMHCDQSAQVRRAEPKNAPWNVLVEKDGEYEISLRRWPREADLAITTGFPPVRVTDGQLPEGKALPIAKARLRIADFDATLPVGASDKVVTFAMKLKAGRTQLQTWFYDADGKELCGAYYTEVRRK